MSKELIKNKWKYLCYDDIIGSTPLYVQIHSYRQDMNIDEMLVNVFERMSRESEITDNEISKVLSENMLDLLL